MTTAKALESAVKTALTADLGSYSEVPAISEPGRSHAVELGRHVQADEGVRVQPVTSNAMAAVEHDHADVRVVNQRINESHPRRASADDEIVRFYRLWHEYIVSPTTGRDKRPRRRPRPGCRPALGRRPRLPDR